MKNVCYKCNHCEAKNPLAINYCGGFCDFCECDICDEAGAKRIPKNLHEKACMKTPDIGVN
jgi:hypothetical protein